MTKATEYKGPKKPRRMVYWPERDEIYVSHEKGQISIYDANRITNGPFCKKLKFIPRLNKRADNFEFLVTLIDHKEHHKGDIRDMKLLEGWNTPILMTVSDDKEVKVDSLFHLKGPKKNFISFFTKKLNFC